MILFHYHTNDRRRKVDFVKSYLNTITIGSNAEVNFYSVVTTGPQIHTFDTIFFKNNILLIPTENLKTLLTQKSLTTFVS